MMQFVSNAPDSTDGFLFFLATGGVSSQLLFKKICRGKDHAQGF